MGQNKQSKEEDNNFFTTFHEQNSYSILQPKLISKIKPIIQPKVGPHTAAWGSSLNNEKSTANTSTVVQ